MNYLFPNTEIESSITEEEENEENFVFQEDQFTVKIFNNQEKDIIEKCSNWSKNRPPDMKRVDEIAEYVQLNNRHIIDGVIYAWKKDEDYLIYDGIHRFEALKKVPYETFFLLSVYETPRENDIIQHFMSLNKSINIPTIYLGQDNYYKKSVCETVAKNLCFKYPKFVSTSRNPYYYNFNRDNFIEFLSSINIDFKHPKASEIIDKILDELNRYSREKNMERQNIPQKCHSYNFYLFILENDFIKKSIENKFNKIKTQFEKK